jgi:hypothetical protein
MKKLFIGIATAAMIMSPVAAKAGSDWIGPAIFGTVFGIIIANNHDNNHTEVIVESPRREYRRGHRRHHHRRHTRRSYEWVEVCKRYPHLRHNRWGEYRTVMRYGCRMVKKARW